MNRLDRYLLSEIIPPFLFAMIAFTSIFAGSSIIPFISKTVTYGFPMWAILQLILYKIPPIVSIILPMAVLLAVILAFSRLSSDRELIALRSMGVSFGRMLVPVLFFGVVMSVINFMFNEVIVPQSNYKASVLEQKLRHSKKNIQNNINLTEYNKAGLPNRILNIRKVSDYDLSDVTVAEFEEGQLLRIIRSESGRWQPEGGWVLIDGVMHILSKSDENRVLKINFKEEKINFDIDLDKLKNTKKSSEEMSIIELRESIEIKQKTGQKTFSDKTDWHLKIALPFVCAIFAVLGACVGVRPHRSTSAVGFGLSLVIIIVYYILYSISLVLGNMQILPPVLVAWVPNIFVSIATLYLLRRVAYQG